MRPMHDLGGLPAGPIEREEHELRLAKRRVDAIMTLPSDRWVFNVAELRRPGVAA
jgi:hypothetical protein